jgi:hypothetical protein
MKKTDLIWKEHDKTSWNAFSGSVYVGYVTKLEDAPGFAYELSGVHTRHITSTEGSGEKRTQKDAQAAVQRAWDEWCDKAGLVPKKK